MSSNLGGPTAGLSACQLVRWLHASHIQSSQQTIETIQKARRKHTPECEQVLGTESSGKSKYQNTMQFYFHLDKQVFASSMEITWHLTWHMTCQLLQISWLPNKLQFIAILHIPPRWILKHNYACCPNPCNLLLVLAVHPLKSGEGRQRKNSEIRCKIRPHCLYMGLKLRLHIILLNFWQLLSGGFAESQPISTCYWHSYPFDQSYPFDPVTVMVKEIQNSNCLHKLFLCISMAM